MKKQLLSAICALMILSGCTSNGKEETKKEPVAKEMSEQEQAIKKEVFAAMDKTLALKGLHINSESQQEETIQYQKNGNAVTSDKLPEKNHQTDSYSIYIDNQEPLKPHYIVTMHSDDSSLVMGEEDGSSYLYMKNDAGKYTLQDQHTVDTSKTENAYLYHFLNYDLMKRAQDCFTYTKDREEAETLYTLKLSDPEGFRNIYNQIKQEEKDENADISVMNSYEIVYRIKDDNLVSIVSDDLFEMSIKQEDNDEYDLANYKKKLHHYTEFTDLGNVIAIDVKNFKEES